MLITDVFMVLNTEHSFFKKFDTVPKKHFSYHQVITNYLSFKLRKDAAKNNMRCYLLKRIEEIKRNILEGKLTFSLVF